MADPQCPYQFGSKEYNGCEGTLNAVLYYCTDPRNNVNQASCSAGVTVAQIL